MAEPTVTLYDILAKPGVGCWSLNTWKARFALNFHGVPHKVQWVSYPDIEPTMRAISAEPGYRPARGDLYTCPVIKTASAVVTDSWNIALHLDEHYAKPGGPKLIPDNTRTLQAAFLSWHDQVIVDPVGDIVCMSVPAKLDERGAEYFVRTRGEWWRKPLDQWVPQEERTAHWRKVQIAYGKLAELMDKQDGDWVMGTVGPTFADFVIAGTLLWIKRILTEEGDGWDLVRKFGGGRWERFLERCEPWMKEQ
ncbi:hypothetical protein AURDEDRAFT_89969 [Auricularia subglabra TFB-10046 SS5]|nr:hypothetical protein AURDEDRAFT_89969 [Auricularia subglabra TFB-10046 SS5]